MNKDYLIKVYAYTILCAETMLKHNCRSYNDVPNEFHDSTCILEFAQDRTVQLHDFVKLLSKANKGDTLILTKPYLNLYVKNKNELDEQYNTDKIKALVDNLLELTELHLKDLHKWDEVITEELVKINKRDELVNINEKNVLIDKSKILGMLLEPLSINRIIASIPIILLSVYIGILLYMVFKNL